MATNIFSRSLFNNKQALSAVFRRSYASLSVKSRPSSALSSLSSFNPLRIRPLVAGAASIPRLSPVSSAIRGFATRSTTSSLNDPSPNWSNRPPKETILLDGCDFEHWLVVMEKPEGDPTRDEIIDSYIQTLATVIGSAEEARMKIYSVSTKHYFAFGALVSEELSYKLKELPRVRWVLPDSYLDVRNKDYGGEPFIDGQAVPYDPKYHEEWVRNNMRANERNRRNDRPRNFDRARNFERRRENMQQNRMSNQGPGPNMGGPVGPPSNMGGPGAPSSNMGSPGGPPSNFGGPGGPPSNYGGPGGPPSNYGGPGGPPSNYGGPGGPPNNYGGPGGPPPRGPPNMAGPPHMGSMEHNNTRGPPLNFQQGNTANNGGQSYQSGPGPNREYQNNYSPSMAAGNSYQTQDMPGRDIPPTYQ